MRALACAAVLAASALATSACGGSHSAGANPTPAATTKTDAIQLHQSGYDRLSLPLQKFINSIIAAPVDGPISEIDVYGPGSRAALVKASSGDIVYPTGREATMQFYLIVAHGDFVCRPCTGPGGMKPPHGTIETHVWSPSEKAGDFGIQDSLPTAVSRLHRLATITLS